MVKQLSSAAWREHGSRCWIFRSISFCYPPGTSVYLWLLSLGSGLVSSYRLPMSFNRKTFFLLRVKLGPSLPRPACFLFEFFCMLVFWIFLQRFLILDHIPVTVCAFSSCVLSLGAAVLGR